MKKRARFLLPSAVGPAALGAAMGGTGGYMLSPEDQKMRGALTGALTGGAIGAGAGIATPKGAEKARVLGGLLGGGAGMGASGLATKKKQAGTPFTEQDRPEKVKEIYKALKRDHPDMPAEMKARIAARQGKRGKQKQGPPYKGPLTKKGAMKKSARISTETLGKLYPLLGPGIGAGAGAALAGEDRRLAGAAAGGALGAIGAPLLGVPGSMIDLAKNPRVRKMFSQAMRGSEPSMGTSARESIQRAAAKSPLMAAGATLGAAGGGALGGKLVQKKKQAALDQSLGHLYREWGPPKEKVASYFFYEVNKDDRDREALGGRFCKLASLTGVDPWHQALTIVGRLPQLEKLASSSVQSERDLAAFYLDWADEIIKKAGIADVGIKGWRAAKAGGKALAEKVPKSSKSRMDQALKAEQAGASIPVAGQGGNVRQAMKSSLDESRRLQQAGGGSIRRGERLVAEDPGLLSAGRAAPKSAPTPAPSAPPVEPSIVPEGVTRRQLLTGAGVLGGLGVGAGALGYGMSTGQTQPGYTGGY